MPLLPGPPDRPALHRPGRADAAAFALTVFCSACDHRPAPSPPLTTPSSSAEHTVAVSQPDGRRSCGAWECRQYDSPAEAFAVATQGAPLIIGIGEAHAPRAAKVASAAKRFAEELLPLLSGRASDLLLELMHAPTDCEHAAAEVRRRQERVTSQQAEEGRSEYVALGERARSVGIVPDLLRPTCLDLDSIRRAGDDAVGVSLETIARLSVEQSKHLVDRAQQSAADRGKAVVLYGGALHNALTPAPERARWSYAPALDAYVGGRFVAIDLIVPEFIRDDDAWRALVWRASYDRERLGAKTTLFRTAEKSWVLVFPVSPAATP